VSRNQRGAGKVGIFVWLAIAVLGVFVGFRTIPVRVAVLQFHDFCDEQTRFAAASNRFGEKELIRDVLNKADELEVPIKKEHVKFERKKNLVRLHVEHELTVDLELYQWLWAYDETFEHIRF